MHPAVISVTRLQAGSAVNVIPTEAVAEGTVRVLVPTDRARVLELVETIAVNTAAAYGCRARVEVKRGDPVLVNDARLVAAVDAELARSGFDVAEPMRSCGADDFAFYGAVCPSLMMFLGVEDHCGQPVVESDADNLDSDHSVTGVGRNPGLHHPNFLPSDETVARAAGVMLTAFTAAAETVLEPRGGN
jgi:amidohydrolase